MEISGDARLFACETWPQQRRKHAHTSTNGARQRTLVELDVSSNAEVNVASCDGSDEALLCKEDDGGIRRKWAMNEH